jgi:hypothetical protein
MPRHPLFDVSPDQIAALDDEGLRLLIARLCEADLRRRFQPGLTAEAGSPRTSAVLYGGNLVETVSLAGVDGGIDVRVSVACAIFPANAGASPSAVAVKLQNLRKLRRVIPWRRMTS